MLVLPLWCLVYLVHGEGAVWKKLFPFSCSSTCLLEVQVSKRRKQNIFPNTGTEEKVEKLGKARSES